MAQSLARDGLNVALELISPAVTDIASLILNRASDTGADLLVMGAYGHSGLREVALGGTTRAMLTAMRVSVLMSH